MPLDVAVNRFSVDPVLPAFNPEDALLVSVNLAPSTTFAKGTILSQVSASANEVHTITITGTPTGGTFTVSGVNPITGASWTTGNIAYNAAASAVASAIAAVAGVGTYTGGGGALPGTAVTITYSGVLAGIPVAPVTTSASLTGGTSPAIAVTRTTTGATAGTYSAFVTGTNTARGILKYGCVTDSEGKITFGSASTGMYFGDKSRTAEMYIAGIYRLADLGSNYGGTALADMGGRVFDNAHIVLGS